jgi:hypothetical protein
MLGPSKSDILMKAQIKKAVTVLVLVPLPLELELDPFPFSFVFSTLKVKGGVLPQPHCGCSATLRGSWLSLNQIHSSLGEKDPTPVLKRLRALWAEISVVAVPAWLPWGPP